MSVLHIECLELISYIGFMFYPGKYRGLAYAGNKDWYSAINDYNQAIKLDPNHTRAYYNRGLAYKSKGSKDKAVKDFQTILNLNDDVESSQNAKQQLQELGLK